MTDNRKAGVLLLCGSLGAMLTMAIHPTAATPHLATMSAIAHGLALLSVPLLLLGALGLTIALNAPDRLAIAALVSYGFASVAILLAATVSGFIMPSLLTMMARDLSSVAPTWRIVIAAIFQINQACSKIYTVGAAAAIALWCGACLRQGRLRGLSVYGIVSALLVTVLLCAGRLRLNVHGMAVVMLTEVVWFVGMGLWLRRATEVRA